MKCSAWTCPRSELRPEAELRGSAIRHDMDLDERGGRVLGGLSCRGFGGEHALGERAIEEQGERSASASGLSAPARSAVSRTHARTLALCSTVRAWTALPIADSAAVLMNAQP